MVRVKGLDSFDVVVVVLMYCSSERFSEQGNKHWGDWVSLAGSPVQCETL